MEIGTVLPMIFSLEGRSLCWWSIQPGPLGFESIPEGKCLGVSGVTFHTHANHSADWRGADTVMGPKGLPLAEGDFKWAVPVTICTLIK